MFRPLSEFIALTAEWGRLEMGLLGEIMEDDNEVARDVIEEYLDGGVVVARVAIVTGNIPLLEWAIDFLDVVPDVDLFQVYSCSTFLSGSFDGFGNHKHIKDWWVARGYPIGTISNGVYSVYSDVITL